MADNTKIEWTDATWNPITGCSVVSPGCTHCYAMREAGGGRVKNHSSRIGLTKQVNGKHVWTGEVRFNEQWLGQPLRWTKPRQIFVCAHGDLFAEGVPDEWIDQVFSIMALAPQHTFQVLTKRPERMRAYLLDRAGKLARFMIDRYLIGGPDVAPLGSLRNVAWPVASIGDIDMPDDLTMRNWPLPNVWLGVSVEDQKRTDERREPMACLAAEGWMTWVSYEPALGQVDWSGWAFLKWLVSGGESGPNARPSHPEWHRAARDYCAASGVPFLFKQWGEYTTAKGYPSGTPIGHVFDDGFLMIKPGKRLAGRLLDGIEHNGYPG